MVAVHQTGGLHRLIVDDWTFGFYSGLHKCCLILNGTKVAPGEKQPRMFVDRKKNSVSPEVGRGPFRAVKTSLYSPSLSLLSL